MTGLGDAVTDAFERSRIGIPKPERQELGKLDKPMLKALRVPSSSAYMRGAKSVSIYAYDNNTVKLIPMENQGPPRRVYGDTRRRGGAATRNRSGGPRGRGQTSIRACGGCATTGRCGPDRR